MGQHGQLGQNGANVQKLAVIRGLEDRILVNIGEAEHAKMERKN